MAYKKLTKKLEDSRILIYNSRNPEIAEALAIFGITSEHIDNGVAKYEGVIQIFSINVKEHQEKDIAYDNYIESRENVFTIFNQTIEIIRMIVRGDKDLQDRLHFSSIQKKSPIEEWINNVLWFYEVLLNEVVLLQKISSYNITEENIIDQKEQVANLKVLRNTVFAEKGEAEEARRLRDEKLADLEEYCYELRTIAKIALKDKPQLLEMLGIKVYS